MTPILQNAGVGVNGMGESTDIVPVPLAAMMSGQQTFVGRGVMGWSTLTASVKLFGPAATTQEFSKKY